MNKQISGALGWTRRRCPRGRRPVHDQTGTGDEVPSSISGGCDAQEALR